MTTWEPATEADANTICILLHKLERTGQTPPISESQLANLTKRQAGALLTSLREMLNEASSKGA